jgi:hypothetical protein
MFNPFFQQLTMAMVKNLENAYMTKTSFDVLAYNYKFLERPEKEFMSLFLLQGKNNVSKVRHV